MGKSGEEGGNNWRRAPLYRQEFLGHLQYISPITTIIYISHSLHNLQDITQSTQQHTTYNISHTTTQLHTSKTHTLNHMDMYNACGLMQAKLISCGAMQISCSVMQIRSNLVVCGCASITWSLIGAILVYFPYLTPLFDRLCRHMTWWLCIVVQFWLFYCVPWLFQASTNPSLLSI